MLCSCRGPLSEEESETEKETDVKSLSGYFDSEVCQSGKDQSPSKYYTVKTTWSI